MSHVSKSDDSDEDYVPNVAECEERDESDEETEADECKVVPSRSKRKKISKSMLSWRETFAQFDHTIVNESCKQER